MAGAARGQGHAQNLGLDVVRSGAILAVLFSHTAFWFMGAGRDTDIRAAYVGSAGVDVFFSLSGFLIGGILLRTLDRGPGPGALLRFWTRRWMRTLPAYYALVLGMCWWFSVLDWRSLLFVQNFTPSANWAPLTPHTWSLVVEEWFYLFVPPMVFLAARLLPRRWAVPAVCAGLFVGCTALRLLAYGRPDPAFWGEDQAINPILRLDCASWGLLAAWFVWRRAGPGRAAAWGLTAIGCAMLVASGIVFALCFTPERLIPYGYLHWALAYQALRTPLVESAAMCVLLGLSTLLPTGRGPFAAAAGAIARYSYALYLVHVPVIYLGRFYGLDDSRSWGIRLVLTLLVVGAAVAMRQVVERPVLALRDRLVPDRRVLPGPALASPGA